MLGEMLENVRRSCPLIHNITNYVTVNDCANILLACGASPIMADDVDEAEEISTLCAGTIRIVLGVIQMIVSTLRSPVIPAFGTNVFAQLTVQEHGAGIFSPGTTEINGVLRTIAGEAAFVQHIAVFLTFRCGSGGGEAVDVVANIEGMDLTMIEIRGRASENKVYLALDIAVPIILSAIFTGRKFFRTVEAAGGKFFCRKRCGEQCILPAEEAAVIEKQAISIGIDCQALTGAVAGSAIILESQIAGGEVMGVSAERRGSEGAALAV